MSPTTNYGATDANTNNANHTRNPHESDSLLNNNHKDDKTSLGTRFSAHMNSELRKDWADLVLLFSYIVTGLLDSSATAIWGSFVSMQTGNTIYLGLGLANPHGSSTRWIKSGVSIACFCLGSLFFSAFHRYFGPKKRWVMVMSSLVQTLLIVVSTFFVQTGAVLDHDLSANVLVPLALVAFQSSGQAVVSRAVQFNALTSVVLTSIYCDLFSDPKLFTAPLTQGVERNRRAAAPLLLLVGAVLGGVWSRSSEGLKGALWTAVVMKALVTFVWCFWKAEAPKPRQTDD